MNSKMRDLSLAQLADARLRLLAPGAAHRDAEARSEDALPLRDGGEGALLK